MNFIHETQRCILEAQKPKRYFPKSKLFYENTYKFLCVCVYEFEQSTTNLSFTFYLKTNLDTYKTQHKSS